MRPLTVWVYTGSDDIGATLHGGRDAGTRVAVRKRRRRRLRVVPGAGGAVAAARLEVQVNSALHPSGVAKSSTSFGWGKGGNVTAAGWQVTPCDPMWHVSFRSGVATLRTAIHLLLVTPP